MANKNFNSADLVHDTVDFIENAELPHPYPALLASFVTEALAPRVAARYIRERRQSEGWQPLVVDWTYIVDCMNVPEKTPSAISRETERNIRHRDGHRCCITGKRESLWDPLVIRPILPKPVGWTTGSAQIYEMLGAFFSPPYRDWWLSVIQLPRLPETSHWLVRQSAAKEFRECHVRLDRLQPSLTEYEVDNVLLGPEKPIAVDGQIPLLGDHSRSGIMKVDPHFIGTHARLCRSVRLLQLARSTGLTGSLANGDSSSERTGVPSGIASHLRGSVLSPLRNVLLSAWLLVPNRVRMAGYKLLRTLGTTLYGGPEGHATVQRLPFGLYVKWNREPDEFRNEMNALRLVRRHTSIPVPQVLDFVHKPAPEQDFFASLDTYLIITRLPGYPLSQCQDVISDRDCKGLIVQLSEYAAEIRSIPKEVNPDMATCNSLGEACRDPRVRGGVAVGPFPDEEAFSQNLRWPDDPARRGHKVVFSHADLNPRNILVDKFKRSDGAVSWQVTGIVDWETSGYYPEYWDCTKAMFESFRWSRRYNKLITAAFERLGDYSKELEIERRSWESGDGI